MAAFIPAFVLLLAAVRFEAQSRFRNLTTSTHREVTLSNDSQSLRLSQPAEIAELLVILRSGRNVGAHHSHPVEHWTLSFPESDERFVLGRDSVISNEYHLYRLEATQTSEVFPKVGIGQFQSAALSEYLTSHGL